MFLVFLKPIPNCVCFSETEKSKGFSNEIQYNAGQTFFGPYLVFHLSSSKAFTQLKALLLLSSRIVELEKTEKDFN